MAIAEPYKYNCATADFVCMLPCVVMKDSNGETPYSDPAVHCRMTLWKAIGLLNEAKQSAFRAYEWDPHELISDPTRSVEHWTEESFNYGINLQGI